MGDLPILWRATCRLASECHVPDWSHRQVVNMTDLAHVQEAAVMPVTRFHGLPIDPAGGIRVSLGLVVLPQGLRAHGPTLDQEHLDLAKDQRVAFQRSAEPKLVHLMQG
jgi:hypothetical protein